MKSQIDQLQESNALHQIEVDKLRAELLKWQAQCANLVTLNECLREFVEDQFCECYDEYGVKKPVTCDRCKLLGRK